MAVLMLIFMICATRINVVYTLIFLSLLLVFLLLSAAYWQLGQGNAAIGDRCVKVSIIPSLRFRGHLDWILTQYLLVSGRRSFALCCKLARLLPLNCSVV
jgi:hypothetical protein